MINFKGVLRSVFFSLLIIDFLQAEDGDVQTSEIVRQYVYEFGVDEMVLIRDVDERGEELSSYFIHQNTQGSVSALSLSNGQMIECYEYDPYGGSKIYDREGQVQSESQVRNSYFYTNRRFDEETGLYYFRHRYLDPKMGRFISRDPLGTWADTYNFGNAYSYGGNDPLNKLDPFGLLSELDRYTEEEVKEKIRRILDQEYGTNWTLQKKTQENLEKVLEEEYQLFYEYVKFDKMTVEQALEKIRETAKIHKKLVERPRRGRSPDDSGSFGAGIFGEHWYPKTRKWYEDFFNRSVCEFPEVDPPTESEVAPNIELPGRNFGPIVMPLPPREEGRIKLPDLTHPAREPQFEDLVVGGSYAGDGYISEGEFPLEVHITQSCLGLLLYKVRFPLPKGTPKGAPRPVGGSTKAGSLSGSLQGASLYPYPPGRKGGYPEGVLPPGSEDNINSGFGTLTIRTGP